MSGNFFRFLYRTIMTWWIVALVSIVLFYHIIPYLLS